MTNPAALTITNACAEQSEGPVMIEFLQQFANDYTPDWRTSDAALDCLQAILEKYKPKSILELGPGLSSFLFYRYAAKDLTITYQVFDHKDTFAYEHASRVKKAGFDPGNITILPLTESHDYDFGKNVIPTADFIFVDGPPASEARLRLVGIFSSPRFAQSIFLIDDTHRACEAELTRLLTRPTHTPCLIRDLNFPPRTSILLVPRN